MVLNFVGSDIVGRNELEVIRSKKFEVSWLETLRRSKLKSPAIYTFLFISSNKNKYLGLILDSRLNRNHQIIVELINKSNTLKALLSLY